MMKPIAVGALALLAAWAAQADEWRIATLNGTATVGDAVMRFDEDGGFGGNTGCNSFNGNGAIRNGRLVIQGPVAKTMMACQGDVMTAQDDAIVRLMQDEIVMAFDPFTGSLALSRAETTLVLTSATRPGSDAAAEETETETPDLASAPYVNVFGLSGHLNIRGGPSTADRIVAEVLSGTLLANQGCEEHGNRLWCNVKLIDASGTEGWAVAEYLEPATAALRAGQGVFDQIGKLSCAETLEGPMDDCDYGVARDPGGSATVVVFRPDGRERLLVFAGDVFLSSDTSEVGGSFESSASSDGDMIFIRLDNERYHVPKAIISGA